MHLFFGCVIWKKKLIPYAAKHKTMSFSEDLSFVPGTKIIGE